MGHASVATVDTHAKTVNVRFGRVPTKEKPTDITNTSVMEMYATNVMRHAIGSIVQRRVTTAAMKREPTPTACVQVDTVVERTSVMEPIDTSATIAATAMVTTPLLHVLMVSSVSEMGPVQAVFVQQAQLAVVAMEKCKSVSTAQPGGTNPHVPQDNAVVQGNVLYVHVHQIQNAARRVKSKHAAKTVQAGKLHKHVRQPNTATMHNVKAVCVKQVT